MKKIKIFLGSSITEFEKERNDLELFIRNVSDEFEEKYNIKLIPLRCENMDNYVRADGTQNAINKELVLGSDMCFFIFFTKAGEFTEEEFRIAFEKFKKDGKPKIYIYFKNIPDGQTVEDSVRNFMSKIDNELKHYHGSFDHIDTIKLRILLNLKLQEMDFVSVEFENGKCMVDGKETLDLSNVSEFANNNILQQLQKELLEVEEHYLQMKPIYGKGNVSDAFYKEYAEVSSKKQNLIDSIEELQKNIFNMSLRICNDEVHGDITIRQKEAYRLFELGDYEGAISVLDAEEINNDFFRKRKLLQEMQKKEAQRFIREHKTAIDILMTMVNYKNRFENIEQRYEIIVPIAEEDLVELEVILNYAEYLYDQKQYNKAIIVAKKLEAIHENNYSVTTLYYKAKLFNLIGSIYMDLNMYNETKIYYNKAIEIKEKLIKDNPRKFSGTLAVGYNNAGCFYGNKGNFDKAKEFYYKAIKIYEKLVDINPDKYIADLASSYNNIGVEYRKQGDVEKALYFCHKSLETIEKSNKDNSHLLYSIYKNFGNLYRIKRDFDKSDAFYNKNIEISKVLAKDNPKRFDEYLADAYNNSGILCSEQGDFEKAYYFYNKALKIIERLTTLTPDKYMADLASSYNNIGTLYYYQDDIEMANSFYRKAIEIREMLVGENQKKYSKDLADSYYNYGNLYNNELDIAKAENFYRKAIEIRERLVKNESVTNNVDLANSYYKIGIFYKNQGNIEEAENFYQKATNIYEKLAKENPEKFNIDLANCYNNAGIFYDSLGDIEKTKNFYNKAIAIYEKLANNEPNKYKPNLAVSYFNFARFTNDIKTYIIALAIAEEYPEHPSCKKIIEYLKS